MEASRMRICLVFLFLLLSGCETVGYLRERNKPIQIPASAMTTALSPRPMFINPPRTLTIDLGQIKVSILKQGKYTEQVMGASTDLPFRDGVFSLIHIGDAWFHNRMAREVYRVAEPGCLALVKVMRDMRRGALRSAGWWPIERGNQYEIYRKAA
jgi:hypothetical protein